MMLTGYQVLPFVLASTRGMGLVHPATVLLSPDRRARVKCDVRSLGRLIENYQRQ